MARAEFLEVLPSFHNAYVRQVPLESGGRFVVDSWSNRNYRGLLWAVGVAIRAAEFQSVTK
jgi:hypothetical protein